MVQNKLLSSSRPEFSPLSIVRMLWKHKLGLVAIWLTLSAISVGVVLLIPATYRAEAVILVDSQKIPEKYVAPSVASELQDRLATISQQILSSKVLQDLITTFDLYHEERKNHVQEEIFEMMRNDIKITVEKGWTGNRPGAFRIGYQGPVPTTVASVANRIATLFIDENLRTRETQAVGTSEFLQSQVDESKKKLDKMEAAVSKYKLEHNGELPEQEASLNSTLQRLQLELQGNQEALNRGQQTKVILENALGMAESAQAALAHSIEDAATADSADSASRWPTSASVKTPKPSELLQQQLDIMRLRYSENHPDVKRLQAEIVKAKAAEAQAEPDSATATAPATAGASAATPKRRPASPEALRALEQERQKASSLTVQLKGINQELEARTAERSRILDSINLYQKHIERLPVREQEMQSITRDYETSKAEYRSLLDKQASAEMATEMERRQKAEKFTLLDPARVPEMPFKPNRPLFAALGILLSLGIGVLYAIGKEVRQNCLLGEWELPEGVATISRVPIIDFSDVNGRKGWQVVLVSSGLISLLGIVAAGLYYTFHRV